jgi:threonine/homoserine/homoserine lactone efflux protein|tara:strand:- start:2356 stop:2970 length:615 start_codon:yes stop_codon:yes gene_type:complete
VSVTSSILELLVIIAIALVIPGPNAITSFAHSGLFGKRSNIPLITGMAIGLLLMELIIGLTVESLRDSDNGIIFLHWIGMIFLALMSIAMFNINLKSIISSNSRGKLGIKTGILMQFFNGKEWAFVILIMSQFIEPLGGGIIGIITIIIVTLIVCIPAMIAWTFVGNSLSELFLEPITGKRIVRICGTLLAFLWVIFFIRGPQF